MLTDTINATYCGGIGVPLKCFSAAKVEKILDISKIFSDYFQKIVVSHGNTVGNIGTELFKVAIEVLHHSRQLVPTYLSERSEYILDEGLLRHLYRGLQQRDHQILYRESKLNKKGIKIYEGI